jgi:hypothetical protein
LNQVQLLTDQALGEGNDHSLDGLGFSTYSRVLGKAAAGTPGPLTIGVFGEWGTGKTSLMRMIQSQLSNEKDIVTVWFNAWRYEKEEHPIVPLIATIVRELERNKNVTAKMLDKGSNLIRALRAVAYGFSAKSKVKVPGFAEVEASFVAKDMIERSAAITPDPLLDRSLYYEAFERLSSIPLKKDFRIVVIVDDLDRCFPDLAIRLLESIKLVLSQAGFIFILGVARSVIEGYLQFRYQKEFGIENFKGQSYLDKIVQLPFHIPSHRGRMDRFADKILERIIPELRQQFESVLPIIGAASGSNPRSTVRFVNNLLIDTAINKDLASTDEMSEIQLEYFAVTRCLQLRWPQVLSNLTSSDEVCEIVGNWTPESYKKEASSEDTFLASVATTLVGDQDLQKLLESSQGKKWLLNSSQRLATLEFLRTQRQESDKESERSTKKYDVFFSYSSPDKQIVAEVAEFLVNQGIRIFMDTEIQVGDSITNVISSAFEYSNALAIFLSPTSVKSAWVKKELEVMLSKQIADSKVRIIPILLQGVDFSDLPLSLQNYNALDLRKGINKEQLQRLARALKS